MTSSTLAAILNDLSNLSSPRRVMPSTFTWLDYSEHERRKMLDVIDLFGEKTTRDELGLGGVRDAFADLLFPGTSTIQTRARYFLFIPWIYLELEEKRTSSARIGHRARKLETELALAIAESEDSAGLIGRRKKENIQRLPSNVYWQGLSTWGIRVFPGSQDEYHRSLDVFYARIRARRRSSHEYFGEAPEEADLNNWHPSVPSPPQGFPEGVSFALPHHEADYLQKQVLLHCPQSLLAHLLREQVPVKRLDFVWQLTDLPEPLQAIVEHGQNFSEVMYGAQLLYNLMLAETKSSSELVQHYESVLEDWCELVTQRSAQLTTWDRQSFWRTVYQSNPRVSSRARSFVDHWTNVALNTVTTTDLIESPQARQLVKHREVQLKGGLSRIHGGRPLEMWSGAAGAAQLDLRWNAASRIAADIVAGLENGSHA
ncbi:MAG: DUF6361 family protein [Planctomycetota bacterium]